MVIEITPLYETQSIQTGKCKMYRDKKKSSKKPGQSGSSSEIKTFKTRSNWIINTSDYNYGYFKIENKSLHQLHPRVDPTIIDLEFQIILDNGQLSPQSSNQPSNTPKRLIKKAHGRRHVGIPVIEHPYRMSLL